MKQMYVSLRVELIWHKENSKTKKIKMSIYFEAMFTALVGDVNLGEGD